MAPARRPWTKNCARYQRRRIDLRQVSWTQRKPPAQRKWAGGLRVAGDPPRTQNTNVRCMSQVPAF